MAELVKKDWANNTENIWAFMAFNMLIAIIGTALSIWQNYQYDERLNNNGWTKADHNQYEKEQEHVRMLEIQEQIKFKAEVLANQTAIAGALKSVAESNKVISSSQAEVAFQLKEIRKEHSDLRTN